MTRRKPRSLSSEHIDRIVVVARGERFVVIDKPSGVLSVPGKGEANRACVATWVQQEISEARGPLVVHRLDMDTSGLLLFGLDEDAQRELSRQFEQRTVEKAYVALVAGHVESESGEIRLPMRADLECRPRQVIDHVEGRSATTRWHVLRREESRTLLGLEPRTGRTHQLRVHLAALGHPILGDALYGEASSAPRLMLHATRLAFDEPGTHRRVDVVSPPRWTA